VIRVLLFALGGILLGGIIHIVTVLQVPAHAPQDTWSRVSQFVPANQFKLIEDMETDDPLIPMLDPMMIHAICRYSLDHGAIRMQASLPNTFWSVALYNRRGENIFSINDRAAGTKDLDMVVLTADQLAIIRENPPEELEDLLVIETLDIQGFALLHLFAGDPTIAPELRASLKDAQCAMKPF